MKLSLCRILIFIVLLLSAGSILNAQVSNQSSLGQQQNKSKATDQLNATVPKPQDKNIFLDDDILNFTEMYHVVEKVTHLTFTGESSPPGGRIQLVAGSSASGTIDFHEDPEPEFCCPTCVSKAYLELRFHLGGDKHTYEQGTTWSGTYSVTLALQPQDHYGGSVGSPVSTTLQLTNTDVEQLYRLNLEPFHLWFCNHTLDAEKISITVSSISFAGGGVPPTPFLRLDADLREEYNVSVKNCTDDEPKITGNLTETVKDFLVNDDPEAEGSAGLPKVTDNPVTLSWTLSIPEVHCPDEYPAFQIQILRLYNIDPDKSSTPEDIKANIDWGQALTLMVNGSQKKLTLTLPEKIGYYLWRVRPIGNYYGGVTNPLDWGNWSKSLAQGNDVTINPRYQPSGTTGMADEAEVQRWGIFYYDPTDFDHSKNWSYSRAFTEDDTREPKIFESITYTDGLGQPEQKQIISQADNTLQAQQFLYDFSGRQSTHPIAAPIVRAGAPVLFLNYMPDLMVKSTGPDVLYGPADVEAAHTTTPVSVPPESISHTYFSDLNSDISVPNADGLPFAQTRYYPDGRVKEVGGVGYEHRLDGGKTSKMFYSGVTEEELVSVFGREAPNPYSVSKVVTIDPDGVASVQYINKEGQTIATCLVNNGELDGTFTNGEITAPILNSTTNKIDGDKSTKTLKNLIGEKVNVLEIHDNFSGGTYTGDGVYKTAKSYMITRATVENPAQLTINYSFTPPFMAVEECGVYCADCKLNIKIRIINRATGMVLDSFIPTYTPPIWHCTPNSLGFGPYTHDITEPGTYLVERIIEPADPKPSIDDYLSDPDAPATLDQIYKKLFNISTWPTLAIDADEPTTDEYYDDLKDMLGNYNNIYGNAFYPRPIDPEHLEDKDPWISSEHFSCENMYLPKRECEQDPCEVIAINEYDDFELYLFRELSDNQSFKNMTLADAKTYVLANKSEFELNNYFKHWKNGNDKFPKATATDGTEGPYYATGANPYGVGLFNDLVANMQLETVGMCVYDCKKLWEAWRMAVAEYKFHIDKNRNKDGSINYNLPVNKQTGLRFDLFERFLDKAGRKLSLTTMPLADAPSGSIDFNKYYNPTNGYLRFAYKVLPVSTDLATFDKCLQMICNDYEDNINPSNTQVCPTTVPTTNGGIPEVWAKYEAVRQCKIGSEIDFENNDFFKQKGLTDCEMPSVPYSASNPEWIKYRGCMSKVGMQAESDCNESCESRRDQFFQVIVDAYAHPTDGIHTPKYLVDTYRPPGELTPPTLVDAEDDDAITLEDILCRVETLIMDCKLYCKIPNFKYDEQGVPQEIPTDYIDEYRRRMVGNPKVDLYNGGTCDGEDPGTCDIGYCRACNTEMTRMKLLSIYLTEKYKELSATLAESQQVNFGEIAQTYMTENGITIPYCFQDHVSGIINGDAYDALQITVFPGSKGEFEYVNFDFCGCYMIFKGSLVPPDEHPWVTELNSYYNDVWGMKMTSPGVVSTDSASTFPLNPSSYYTVMRYNSGTFGSSMLEDSLEARAIQFVDRMRYYNVNGRMDSTEAFMRIHSLDSIVVTVGAGRTIGVVNTRIRDIIHVTDATDTLYGGTWRSYNIGLWFPVPYPYLSKEGGFQFSLQRGDTTGDTLTSLAYIHRIDYLPSGDPDTNYSTSTSSSSELRSRAAAPELSGSQKFTDIIGRFEQTPEGYLAFRDLSTNMLKIYEHIQFSNTNTRIIGGSDCGMAPNKAPMCTTMSCNLCVKWEEDMDPFPEHDKKGYRAMSCEEKQINAIKHDVALQYQAILNRIRSRFEEGYKAGCLSGKITDNVQVSFDDKYYHYTLYYYDRSGNLVRTVPPEGVDMDPTFTRSSIPDHADHATSGVTPSYSSTYGFNTLKLPVEENTVDGGSTCFAYSKNRLLRFSQNARQRVPVSGKQRYSFTRYDTKGRVIETGEGEVSTEASSLCSTLTSDAMSQTINQTISASNKNFTTTTVYTTAAPSFSTPYSSGLVQHNLRNRVSFTVYDQDGDYDASTDPLSTSGGVTVDDRTVTYYSYDAYGNVEWVIQDAPIFIMSGTIPRLASKVDYEYDLISGKVNALSFRVGYNDRMYQRYGYDRNDRLVKVESSRDGVIWDKDGSYEYYQHGPMSRLAIGEDSLQGMDYTYTIQGWLKAINHSSLTTADDPGGDGGNKSSTLTAFSKDAFGMTLNYYEGDFKRLYYDPLTSTTTHSVFNSTSSGYTKRNDHLSSSYGLFGGNIAAWSEQVYTPSTGMTTVYNTQATGSTYRYDMLNRIKDDQFMVQSSVGSTNSYSTNSDFKTSGYTYDANGNLKTLKRYAQLTGGWRLTDELTYTYQNNNNRLDNIFDSQGAQYVGSPGGDLSSQTSGNYTYDATGNMITDAANLTGGGVTWTPFNKVNVVTTAGGATTISHLYNSSGNIVRKLVDATGTANDIATYYVYDAAGKQLLAVYEQKKQGSTPFVLWGPLTFKEAPIYGENRLGMFLPGINRNNTPLGTETKFTRTLEKKQYELTDHLGNVRSVITDMKIPSSLAFLPEETVRNYYYPFGMERPRMSATLTGKDYRFGYNGKENDDDWNKQDYGFRTYDPRVARFLSVDPLRNEYPWYSPFQFAGNTPIQAIDMDGLEPAFTMGTNQDLKETENPIMRLTVQEIFYQLYPDQAGKAIDFGFDWSVGKYNDMANNNSLNNTVTRANTAEKLVEYIKSIHNKGEPITLIGYSNGNNVNVQATPAIRAWLDSRGEHGTQINLISLSSPAFTTENHPENLTSIEKYANRIDYYYTSGARDKTLLISNIGFESQTSYGMPLVPGVPYKKHNMNSDATMVSPLMPAKSLETSKIHGHKVDLTKNGVYKDNAHGWIYNYPAAAAALSLPRREQPELNKLWNDYKANGNKPVEKKK